MYSHVAVEFRDISRSALRSCLKVRHRSSLYLFSSISPFKLTAGLAEAEAKPNGQGQEAPNDHPELPKPTGRKAAPWDIAGKAGAFWAAHKWKIVFLILLAAVGCGVGIWFYFTYGPGALLNEADRKDKSKTPPSPKSPT
jgi:hypothetical protein